MKRTERAISEPVCYRRAFLALLPDAETVARLHALIEPMRLAEIAAMRPLVQEDWHVTAAFIGDIDAAGRRDTAALLEAAPVTAAPALHLTAIGAFPHRRPRVLAAFGTVEERFLSQRIGMLQRLEQLETLQYTTDTRAYRPHITIAWCRASAQLPREQAIDIRFVAPTLSLMAKASDGDRRRYRMLETRSLQQQR